MFARVLFYEKDKNKLNVEEIMKKIECIGIILNEKEKVKLKKKGLTYMVKVFQKTVEILFTLN